MCVRLNLINVRDISKKSQRSLKLECICVSFNFRFFDERPAKLCLNTILEKEDAVDDTFKKTQSKFFNLIFAPAVKLRPLMSSGED